MTELRQNSAAEAAETATRRFRNYEDRVKGPLPSSDNRLRLLKRDADRAKLALHIAAARTDD